jgi:hypothetical protein
MSTPLSNSVFLAVALLLTVALPAQAAVVNGGFETGTFAGWSVVGDTSVQTASVGISPTQGCCMALLTTINTDFGGVPFSTHFASSGALQTFLGYSLFEVQTFPFAYPGRNAPYGIGQSAIKQTVQGHAGELLSFDAYWVTTDGADNAVLSIVPSTSGPKVLVFLSPPNVLPLPTTTSPFPLCQHSGEFGGSQCSFANQTTGWLHYDVLLSTTDTFTIGFAVYNGVDSLAPSALLIDSVELRVPQASTATLLLVGLLGLLVSRRWILGAK